MAQHVLSIAAALLIAAAVRLFGAPRVFSLLAFLLASLYARTVHFDNTVGAETISVFLTSVAVFIASGVVFRRWPPLRSPSAIGLSLGAVMICRSASVGAAVVILAVDGAIAGYQMDSPAGCSGVGRLHRGRRVSHAGCRQLGYRETSGRQRIGGGHGVRRRLFRRLRSRRSSRSQGAGARICKRKARGLRTDGMGRRCRGSMAVRGGQS